MTVIECITRFDITATGVVGQYKHNQATNTASDGLAIDDQPTWIRCRNQQRNWETMNQVISLRCLPEQITKPQRQNDVWIFRFSIENTAAISDQPDDLGFLITDAHGVPMIVGLDEATPCGNVIQTIGVEINTTFRVIAHKYATGESDA